MVHSEQKCRGWAFLGHDVGLVVPLQLAAPAFLGRGLLRIRSRCLGGRAVGGRGSSRFYRASQEMRLMCIVPNTLLTLLSLRAGRGSQNGS